MVQRRRILEALTRATLADLAAQFGLVGLSGKSKDAVVRAIAGARAAKTADLLEYLSRDELKALCRVFGLNVGGRDKRSLIGRLAGNTDSNDSPCRAPSKMVAGEGAGVRAAGKRGKRSMTKKSSDDKRPIEQYEHADKTRVNNPPVGLVTPATDPDLPKKTYQYDPHLDPQLVWAGKAEHTSFEVPTVSLHVHERIDPRTIIRAVQKRNGDRGPKQLSLFEEPEENPPLREAIESGDSTKIALWMLDTDYDGRSIYPRQVFFPMAGPKDGWARLAKNLKAEIDEDLIEAYRGTVSLPFAPGEYKRAAVKIVDDRGIESLKIIPMG